MPPQLEKRSATSSSRDIASPGTTSRDIEPSPTPKTSLSSRAPSLDTFTSNPFLPPALQILDQLSDVARVLPFVAPVFVLLKIAIDIERRATEADAKCADLLERIVFMTSHLPALEALVGKEGEGGGGGGGGVPRATLRVVEKMNDALKGAVALIGSYRKQGQVARRLNLGNRDKFNACAELINTCSSDLLISLQIHQSTQLDALLSRAVPKEPEDEAAEAFVRVHGGAEAVRRDERLVREFAESMRWRVEEGVMEQIGENVALVMREQSVRLERALGENVSTGCCGGVEGPCGTHHLFLFEFDDDDDGTGGDG